MIASSVKLGRRKRGLRADTRVSILAAATHEFAEHGPAGARIATIARRAGVNIALVYYYFSSKSQLYRAILEDVFQAWFDRMMPILSGETNPQDCILEYVTTHFDFLAEAPLRANLIQAELSRRDPELLAHIQKLAGHYVRPVHSALAAVLSRGVRTGGLRKVDAEQTAITINGLVTAYFTAAPLIRALRGTDPLSPSQLQRRKAAIVDFIQSALFVQRKSATSRKTSV